MIRIAVVAGLTLTAACSATPSDPAPTPVVTALTPRRAAPATPLVASSPAVAVSAAPPDPCGVLVANMACIPGGTFLRGTDGGNANEKPQASIDVDAFLMDVTEVTVEAFDACVASKACKPVHTIYSDFSRPKQPKVGVSWFDARDYCRAMKKHLPTEAEWEKAARGTDGRRFPWGDEPITCERAIIMDASGRGCGVKKEGGEPEKGRTAEVGSRPPNPYGLFDMAGNAWEWVADWYTKSYAACGAACAEKNPLGPCDGADRCAGVSVRVVRGGSWYWEGDRATTTYRAFHEPSNDPYHHYGFRCAASLEEAAKLRQDVRAFVE